MVEVRVRNIITKIFNTGISGPARSAGFRKSGFYFYRRSGEVVQVIHFQLSQTNSWASGQFYINIGLVFDQLQILGGRPVTEKPKDMDCYHNFRMRLENIVRETPPVWEISATTNTEQVAQTLRSKFSQLLSLLDPIDSIPTFINMNWTRPGSDYGLLARLYYCLGDMESAIRYVEMESAFFADRLGMSIESLIAEYRLIMLVPKAISGT